MRPVDSVQWRYSLLRKNESSLKRAKTVIESLLRHPITKRHIQKIHRLKSDAVQVRRMFCEVLFAPGEHKFPPAKVDQSVRSSSQTKLPSSWSGIS